MSLRPTPVSGVKLALLASKARAESPDGSIIASDPIAITGIGCRFPGGVSSPAEYWTLVHNGTDAIRIVPPERWNADRYYSSDPHEPGRMNTRWGGFLDHTDEFDPIFFGLSPREAVSMDPQQRLLLEVSWEALWDAGYAPAKLAGSPTGVFVAVSSSDYARLLLEEPNGIGPHTAVGSEQSIASGRISFLLDLRGPSIVLDTACSSSLIAVHLACHSLRSGECRMAVAGGVTLKFTPEHYLSLSKLAMLSPDGRCMTFDARANGFVPGEGCGMVVLKRLSDALADGDRIYALIRGTASNQDGRTSVITAPSGRAQEEVVRAALANARVSGADVTYVETHGTGTPLGDPIEVEALTAVLDAPGAPPCALGAVKSNMGHLEVTAGVAGLIKAALALDREEIPPNLHFRSLNPRISLDGTRLFVPTEPTPWKRGGAIRFAGVSSFGFSGTNGHVILEEAPLLPRRSSVSSEPPSASIFVASARTPEALDAFAERYRGFMNSEAGLQYSVSDICTAAASRRDRYEERVAVTGASHEEIRDRLLDAIAGRTGAGISRARAPVEAVPAAFVFSGQGSQWPTMGTGLMREEPVFRSAIEECDALVSSHASWSLVDVLSADDASSLLSGTEYAQAAICAIEIALARLLASWGVVPSVVIGHSAGEIAAAHVSGSLSLAEAMRLIVHRGRIMQAATGKGTMVSVSLAPADVMTDIESSGGKVSIAAMNGLQSTVISGGRDDINALTAEWRSRGVEFRPMPVDYAFHSHQMDGLLPELERAFGTVRNEPGTIPLISTVTGLEVSGAGLNGAHWVRAVRQPVLFRHAIEAALARGIRRFVEIGPHPVLSWDIGQSASRVDGTIPVLPTLRRGRPERAALLGTVGGLFVAGHSLRWEKVCGGRGPVVPLPAYPYQRQRYWLEAPADASPRESSASAEPFALSEVDSPALRGRVWETTVDLKNTPFLADHIVGNSVVFPMTGYVELAIKASRELGFSTPLAVEDLTIREPLALSADEPTRIQLVVETDRLSIYSKSSGGWRHHVSAALRAAGPVDDDPEVACGNGQWSSHSIADFYAAMRKRRLNFGPGFQCVKLLRSSGRVVEAEVSLPFEPPPGVWTLHPALLDACLQASMAVDNDGSTYLPIAIDRLSVFRPAGGSVYCRLAVQPATARNTETVSADFVITTSQGERIAAGHGLLLKRVSREADEEPESRMFEVQWVRSDTEPPTRTRIKTALVIGDLTGWAGELASDLRLGGVACELRSAADVDDATLARHSCVIFAGAAEPPSDVMDPVADQQIGCRPLLDLAQRIIGQDPLVVRDAWVITRDAQRVLETDGCAGFAHATMWGLARTLALEHPMIHWIRCDIDVSSASRAGVARAIQNRVPHDEIAFRSGKKFRSRIAPLPGAAPPIPSRLAVSERGSVENLHFVAVARKPIEPHQVEIEVHTSALNFRDILNVLGAYPGDAGPLGAEFCGCVLSVGSAVTQFRAGDRVMGISWGGLSDVVAADAELVTHVPAPLSDNEAVTLPNAFATVYHSLVEVAGLRAGERVLIHAAAGGVGFMAVQLALHLGAEVYATAGSDDKRRFLRSAGVKHVFDSRSLAFAEQVREATQGEGVHVALNSLAGDFIGATLSVVARGGRFVEIGKTGIWRVDKVAALGRDIRYTVADLAEFVDHAPARIANHFERLHECLASGAIRPLPHHAFRFEAAAAAFRFMERGRHIGKIVLRHSAASGFSPAGTWLITGGAGALGLEVAEWLGSLGAERLLLIGRKPPGDEALVRIDALRDRGVQVDVHQIDLAGRDAFEKLDSVVRDTGPRLAGMAHLAGIVDDGIVEQQSWMRFQKVFDPKVTGAWLAHQLATGHRVPQLLLFSSIAAVIGSPGQSGYAAANAFLDSLAAYRAGRGEPAVSIDWGAWAAVGMAARLDASGKRLGLGLVRSMPPNECLSTIPRIVNSGVHHAAVFSAEQRADGTLAAERLHALMAAPEDSAQLSETRPESARPKLPEQLEGLARPRARKLVIEHLRDEVRVVLGLASNHLIDEWQPLMKIGLDSLMALEMRNRVAAAFGRPFSATLLFDRPTIGALADFLVPAKDQDTTVERDEMLDAVTALSDEEAELLLAKELGVTPETY